MILETALIIIVCTIHPTAYCLIVLAPATIAALHSVQVEKAFMLAFPDDYVEGLPVYTPEQRAAALEISKAKMAEAKAAEEEY